MKPPSGRNEYVMEDDTKANSMMNHNMLTKREYAAIQILAGIAAPDYGCKSETLAEYAVHAADALFDALAEKAGA